MNVIQGTDVHLAEQWMNNAKAEAVRALCLRDSCGAVIVNNGNVIGKGYNAPPQDDINNRHCLDSDSPTKDLKHDRTCCVHAEWRAIMDALRRNSGAIKGSRLYFVRLDPQGNIAYSGKPYCTVCSRLALDAGITEFVLWHKEGITVYPTQEYNRISYEYHSAQA